MSDLVVYNPKAGEVIEFTPPNTDPGDGGAWQIGTEIANKFWDFFDKKKEKPEKPPKPEKFKAPKTSENNAVVIYNQPYPYPSVKLDGTGKPGGKGIPKIRLRNVPSGLVVWTPGVYEGFAGGGLPDPFLV